MQTQSPSAKTRFSYINLITLVRQVANELPLSVFSWISTFSAVVLIRILFEQFSSYEFGRYVLIDLPMIVHFATFYLAATLALVGILIGVANIRAKEAFNLCLMGLPIIWIPPCVDLIVGGSGGFIMSYLWLPPIELLGRFFTFFGGHINKGITLGIQTELAIVIISLFAFTNLITKSVRRAVLASVIGYSIFFIFSSLPSFMSMMLSPDTAGNFGETLFNSIINSHIISSNNHPQFTSNANRLFDLGFNKLLTQINLLIAMVILLGIFFSNFRNKFIAVLHNSRPERLTLNTLFIIWGISLSNGFHFINWIDIQSFILTLFSFGFAWIFCVCENDAEDILIDSISNQKRPLITGKLTKDEMSFVASICLVFAILFAYAVGHYVLFFVILYLGIYHIYSASPLRLKRIPILSSFLLSIAWLALILSGFFLVGPEKGIIAFPFHMAIALIAVFTIAANVRDLKDIEGDRAGNIMTLPVLLGELRAKKILASLMCIISLSVPFYLHIPILIFPSIVAAVLFWFFLTAKNYREWKFLLVVFLYIALYIGTLVFTY